jgi:hypothetical protein
MESEAKWTVKQDKLFVIVGLDNETFGGARFLIWRHGFYWEIGAIFSVDLLVNFHYGRISQKRKCFQICHLEYFLQGIGST